MTTGSLPNPGRYIFSALSIAAALLASACAKNGDTTQTETPAAANPAASASAPELSSTAAAAIDTATAEARATELTQVVRKYAAEKQRAPKSFDELVAAGYLPSAPSAPAGKAYIIDKNLQVQLADQ